MRAEAMPSPKPPIDVGRYGGSAPVHRARTVACNTSVGSTRRATLSIRLNGGLGILEMQERLRKMGGRLEIRSSNQGTLLSASIYVS